MAKLQYFKWGKTHEISFEVSEYIDCCNLYIGMIAHEDGFPEPWSDLTVNLGIPCPKNCAFIDTNNNGEDIISWLQNNHLGYLTGRRGQSGHCIYPEFCFDTEKLKEYFE